MAKGYQVDHIELVDAGFRKLFQEETIRSACRRAADEVKNRAGGAGYSASDYAGPHRVGAAVFVTSEEAYEDNLDGNTLIKALREVLPDTETKGNTA